MMDHIKLLFDLKFDGSRCNMELLYELSLELCDSLAVKA
jgi:hypothetical protein